MEKVEKVTRALAQADGNIPDAPLTGYKRIVGQTIPIFKYDTALPLLALGRRGGISGAGWFDLARLDRLRAVLAEDLRRRLGRRTRGRAES